MREEVILLHHGDTLDLQFYSQREKATDYIKISVNTLYSILEEYSNNLGFKQVIVSE